MIYQNLSTDTFLICRCRFLSDINRDENLERDSDDRLGPNESNDSILIFALLAFSFSLPLNLTLFSPPNGFLSLSVFSNDT